MGLSETENHSDKLHTNEWLLTSWGTGWVLETLVGAEIRGRGVV